MVVRAARPLRRTFVGYRCVRSRRADVRRCVVMAQIALSGVIGALFHALDIAEGQPAGHAVRTCLIGMRIASELDLDAAERSDLFYALLLKDAGCSVNANRMARTAKASSKLVDWTNPPASFLWSLRTAGVGGGLRRRFELLRGIREEGDVTRSFTEARCDRGAEIARMLFLSEETATAIRSLDEHWDGRGMPDGLRGLEIPLPARIACIAQTVEVFHASGAIKVARAIIKRRSGRWFDPPWSTWFCGSAATGTSGPSSRRLTSLIGRRRTSRSPPMTPVSTVLPRHSRELSTPSRRSPPATRSAWPRSLTASLRCSGSTRASGEHCDGRRCCTTLASSPFPIASSTSPASSATRSSARFQTHPVHTLSILERAPCFAELADLAANHHERLDGSGYPRALGADDLDLAMRVLAVADVYEALTAGRPYRGPLWTEEALAIIDRDVPHLLDADARNALHVHRGRTPVAARVEPLAMSHA